MQTYDAWHNQVNLATHSEKVGKFEIAEKNWLHALTVAESAPEGQELRAYTLQRLGRCAWALERPTDAEQYYLLALEASPSGEMIGSITEDLAKFYTVFDRRDSAINYYRYSIEVKSGLLGPDHEQVVRLNDEYKNVLIAWNIESELPLQAEAPQPVESNHPVENPEQANAQISRQAPTNNTVVVDEYKEANNILQGLEVALEQAQVKHREGQFDESKRHWREALEIAELCGKDTPLYCSTLEKIAQLLNIQGQQKKAEKLLLESYSIKMKVLGPNHESVAKTTQELSIMYFEIGSLDKAEPWAKRCLDIYDNLGLENEELACALHNLAVLYHSKEDYIRSEPYYTRALVLKQRLYGPSHLETINIMRGYADLLHKTNRTEAGKEMELAASGVLSGAYEAQPMNNEYREEYIPCE